MPDNTETSVVTWDGSTLTRTAWHTALPQHLAALGFRTLWEGGYVNSRYTCITVSTEHSFHIINNNVAKGTFAKPNPAGTFKVIDAKLTATDLTAEQLKRYIDFPTAIAEKQQDLLEAILQTITNVQRQIDYRFKTGGCGIAMLLLIEAETVKGENTLAQWAATRRAELVAKGLAAANTVSFDQFRNDYETFTKQMGARAEPDSVWAQVYCQAVRDLGELIGTRLDLDLAVSKPSTLGTYVDAIHTILGVEEAKPQSRGRALGLGGRPAPAPDPAKNLWDASGSRRYVKGTDEKCTICADKTPVDGGHHLRMHCAHYIRPTDDGKGKGGRKGSKGRKGSARSASAGRPDNDACPSADEDDDDDSEDASEFYADDAPSIAEVDVASLFASEDGGSVQFGRVGSARALRKGGGRPADAASPGVPAQPETPPPPLELAEARARVAQLTPESPISAFRAANVDAGLNVSMATGGVGSPTLGLPPNRSRHHILLDMRQALDMGPPAVPVGIRHWSATSPARALRPPPSGLTLRP